MSSGTTVTGDHVPKPMLLFTQLAWEKIWKITRENRVGNTFYECSSMGIMSETTPNLCEDVWVPLQKNTGAGTVMDGNALLADQIALRDQGCSMSRFRMWHHTHANFNVFWSGTDTDTIQRQECDGIQWSIVTNAKGEYKVRADIFQPIRAWWDNCDVDIVYPKIDLTEWYATAKLKIENPAPVDVSKYKHTNTYTPGSAGGRNGGYMYKQGANWTQDPTTKLWSPPSNDSTTTLTTMTEAAAASTGDKSPEAKPETKALTTQNEPAQASLQLEVTTANGDVVKVVVPTIENPLIEAALNSGECTELEAQELDMRFKNKDITKEGVNDMLAFYARQHKLFLDKMDNSSNDSMLMPISDIIGNADDDDGFIRWAGMGEALD